MKKGRSGRLTLISLCAFLLSAWASSAAPACGDFNLFRQRKLVIDGFENWNDDPAYDPIGAVLGASLTSYARTILFFALSDEERLVLEELAGREEYQDRFAAAGKRIRYTLDPVVEGGTPSRPGGPPGGPPFEVEPDFPLTVFGRYEVKGAGGPEETVSLLIAAWNGITGRTDVELELELPLPLFLSRPELYLVPFFRELLRYTAHTVSFSADPPDSLIYLDGRLVGVGTTGTLLVPRGDHRLTVQRQGYEEYTTIVNIREEGTVRTIVLAKLESIARIRFVTEPAQADLYVDERYEGTTPLEVELSGHELLFTFKKEGYIDTRVRMADLGVAPVDSPPAPERGGYGPVVLEPGPLEPSVREPSVYEPVVREVRVSLVRPVTLEETRTKADSHRRRSGLFYAGGIGMLAATILLGTRKTLYEQEADLYRGKDDARADRAADRADTYGILVTGGAVATIGLFTFSFYQMLKYFTLYGEENAEEPRARER